jgi:hypothetical protein
MLLIASLNLDCYNLKIKPPINRPNITSVDTTACVTASLARQIEGYIRVLYIIFTA